MAAKILQGITGRWESCILLLTALVEQGAGVATAQLLSVTPHLEEGDVPPDFISSIVARARRLKATMINLVQADHRLYKLDALLVKLRTTRGESISALAAAIVDLRRHVQFHYENPDLVALGLHSPREYRAEPLFRQALLIDEAFQNDDLEEFLGQAKYEGGVDPRQPAAKVGESVTRLRTVLDDINKTRRHYDEAVIEKNGIQAEHDELFTYTARSFEADCRLAGKKELARKVRPSEKRPGETEVPPDVDIPVPEPGEDPPSLPVLSPEESRALFDSE